MFLAQVPTTAGLEVSIIADLDPAKAKRSCAYVGWPDELISRTEYVDDAMVMMTSGKVDVLVEATGNPAIGVVHARAAIRNGIHIVMVNVEADVLAGAQLAQEAASAGVVYSMAYGDQPALTCELVDWARSNGFNVVAAGKGTKFLPSYHASTPDTVWDHYGMTAEQATAAGMNSQMFNSFLDGTKSALEMAAIANATGLAAPDDGLLFPPAGMDDLAQVLRPRAVGGQLDASGMVEVVSSLERDGRPVFKDLRWGVYVVIEAPNDYTAACFRQYGMNTDETGRYSAMYKPFHLIGLELNISILSAALLGKATGSTKTFTGDVVATAKRQLKAGEILDGEGGYTVWGKLYPAYRSLQMDGLPIGLAQNVRLITDVPENAAVRWQDVEIDHSLEAIKIRRALEQASARLHP
jgi:predicted homoserine dehydrogenase-like protein